MKRINAFILALTLSFAVHAQDTNPPAPTPIAEPAPAQEPAASVAAPAKPAAKKLKKHKAQSKAAQATSKKSAEHVDINPPETGVVKEGVVNLRGRPSFIGEVVGKVKKGDSVQLLEEITQPNPKKGEPAQWFRIELPTNNPVWVHSDFVDPTTKTVIPKKLNVRGGPGENFSTLGTLEKGTVVKELRSVNGWTEIETPANAYAFVAADLIDRSPAAPTPAPETTAPETTPAPAPAPEIVAVPPVETNAVPAAPETPAPAQPVTPEPAPATPAPEVAQPPVETAPPVVEEPLPKRIITREGIVRRSFNVQTPSYFELESPDTGKIINYLYSSQPGFTLKPWVGTRVIVTGEEVIDKRWPNTPVIEIQSIDQR